ncbi:MAG: GNAT family N-acetyltransferase [Paenirhodobacter sp.]|uniref:GNAT family N-acetyltransferase n=1 Tax=Paenirhodobacter sp. TaxID=1965326 RepID=UPI003D0C5404
MRLSIRHGVTPAERAQAARLYWQAFGGKLGRVMGPERKALAFIERVMDADHVIVAADEAGTIAGVIGYRTQRSSFVGGTRADLIAVYGHFGAFWRALALSVLAQDLAPGEISVDGLAVRDTARGCGLGGALVEALCREAQMRGFALMRLDVVGENLRARALYDRLGFRVSARADSRLTALIFGFRSRFAMERAL